MRKENFARRRGLPGCTCQSRAKPRRQPQPRRQPHQRGKAGKACLEMLVLSQPAQVEPQPHHSSLFSQLIATIYWSCPFWQAKSWPWAYKDEYYTRPLFNGFIAPPGKLNLVSLGTDWHKADDSGLGILCLELQSHCSNDIIGS